MQQSITNLKLAEGTVNDGWTDGVPAQVPAAVVQEDRRIYSGCRCSACGRRAVKTTAQHNGQRYRIVGRCGWCGGLDVF